MSFERFNVLSAFENPEQADTLYIYKIVNYTGTKEIVFKQNVVNHIFLEMIGTAKGVIFEHKKEISLKNQNWEKEAYAINLKTTKRFASNETILNRVLHDPNNYVFGLEEWEEGSDVELYLIAEADIDQQKLFAREFEELGTNQEQKLFSQYYELILTSYNDVARNSGVIINFWKDWKMEKIDEIVEIEYEIPPDTLLSSIDVFGDIYNETTGEILENILLPLEIKKAPNFLPIWANLNNLENPQILNVKNLKNDFQANIDFVKKSVLAKSKDERRKIESFFEEFEEVTENKKPQKYNYLFSELFKQLFMFTWLARNDFIFINDVYYDKALKIDQPREYNVMNNEHFRNYYDERLRGKSLFDHNKKIIEETLKRHPGIKNTVLFDVFKGVLRACSDFIVSPYMFFDEKDKKKLWWHFELEEWYFDIKILKKEDFFKKIRTILNIGDAIEIYLKFNSFYFDWNEENNSIDFKTNDLKNYFSSIPEKIKLENLNEQDSYFYKDENNKNNDNNYFFYILTYNNLDNFLSNKKNSFNKKYEENIVIKTRIEPLKLEDWLKFLPYNLRKNHKKYLKIEPPKSLTEDYPCDNNLIPYYTEIIKKSKNLKDNEIKVWWVAQNKEHYKYCDVKYEYVVNRYGEVYEGVPIGKIERLFPIEPMLRKGSPYILYENKAHVKYDIKEYKKDYFLISKEDLLIIDNKNIKNLFITYELKHNIKKYGWKIIKLRKDKTTSFWNSPCKLKLKIKSGKNLVEKQIILNYSFQKNNPLITITENLY